MRNSNKALLPSSGKEVWKSSGSQKSSLPRSNEAQSISQQMSSRERKFLPQYKASSTRAVSGKTS